MTTAGVFKHPNSQHLEQNHHYWSNNNPKYIKEAITTTLILGGRLEMICLMTMSPLGQELDEISDILDFLNNVMWKSKIHGKVIIIHPIFALNALIEIKTMRGALIRPNVLIAMVPLWSCGQELDFIQNAQLQHHAWSQICPKL